MQRGAVLSKRYRIVEYRGYIKKERESIFSGLYGMGRHCGDTYREIEIYIPKYIVQKRVYQVKDGWENLKEFNNLNEARNFKRDLELEGGIEVE